MDGELEQLGERIAEQAAHLDAATHRLLADLRVFDERGGWRAQGALSCAHWLSWRVGWSLATARDHVRVARKISEFPAIDDALRRGEVSYSKVRAMLRVATPANELLLLDYARLMTGSQLEETCRKYALVLRHGQDPHPLGDLQRRYVRRRDTEDGMVKIEAVLHPEEAELVWTMLSHAATKLTRIPESSSADVSAETRPSSVSSSASAATSASAVTSTSMRPSVDAVARRLDNSDEPASSVLSGAMTNHVSAGTQEASPRGDTAAGTPTEGVPTCPIDVSAETQLPDNAATSTSLWSSPCLPERVNDLGEAGTSGCVDATVSHDSAETRKAPPGGRIAAGSPTVDVPTCPIDVSAETQPPDNAASAASAATLMWSPAYPAAQPSSVDRMATGLPVVNVAKPDIGVSAETPLAVARESGAAMSSARAEARTSETSADSAQRPQVARKVAAPPAMDLLIRSVDVSPAIQQWLTARIAARTSRSVDAAIRAASSADVLASTQFAQAESTPFATAMRSCESEVVGPAEPVRSTAGGQADAFERLPDERGMLGDAGGREAREGGGGDRESGGGDRESGGGDRESGGRDRESGGRDRESGGRDRESGGGDRESGGRDRESGGRDRESGGEDRASAERRHRAAGDRAGGELEGARVASPGGGGSVLRQRDDASRRAFSRADALVSLAQAYLRGDRPNRTPIEVVLSIPASSLRTGAIDPIEAGEIGESYVSGETARRISCDCGVVEVIEDEHGTPLSVGRKRRTFNGMLKRALVQRDKTCSYPGCTNHLFLEGHHIKHWADGGETSLMNAALMCSTHHLYVHEYGYTIELDEGQRPRFRDPRGRLVAAVPERPVTADLGWPRIRATNAPLGIDADTIACEWDGRSVNYHAIVGHLVVADGLQ